MHEQLIISQKEHFDKEVIQSALQKISENEAKEHKIHVIYAGHHYRYFGHEDKLRSIILNGMKKYKIKSVMVTSIWLFRRLLITKVIAREKSLLKIRSMTILNCYLKKFDLEKNRMKRLIVIFYRS